jgi:hypothetical protein
MENPIAEVRFQNAELKLRGAKGAFFNLKSST